MCCHERALSSLSLSLSHSLSLSLSLSLPPPPLRFYRARRSIG
jgi:hypothetical protein